MINHYSDEVLKVFTVTRPRHPVRRRWRALRARRASGGHGKPEAIEQLSPIELRSFLLRGAELIQHSPYADGPTPKTTSSYDGTQDDESEELNQPDFSP